MPEWRDDAVFAQTARVMWDDISENVVTFHALLDGMLAGKRMTLSFGPGPLQPVDLVIIKGHFERLILSDPRVRAAGLRAPLPLDVLVAAPSN